MRLHLQFVMAELVFYDSLGLRIALKLEVLACQPIAHGFLSIKFRETPEASPYAVGRTLDEKNSVFWVYTLQKI